MSEEQYRNCKLLLQNCFNKFELKPSHVTTHGKFMNLEQLVINKLIKDAHSCKEARFALPMTLIEKIFVSAILQTRDLVAVELIQSWKYETICLSSLLSQFSLGFCSFIDSDFADIQLNNILWVLLNAVVKNAPKSLKCVDLTGLPVTFICDTGRFRYVNQLTKSNILREINNKGIKTLVDVCIENWTRNSYESSFGVVRAPKRLCLHQSAEADFLDFPFIDADSVKQISLACRMNITEYNLNDIIEFNFKNLTDLNVNFPVYKNLTIEKLSECLKTFPLLQRLRIGILQEGELSKLVKEVPTFSKLTYLKVVATQWDKNDIESISVCKNVVHLSLVSTESNQQYLQLKLQSILSKLPELRQLELHFKPNLDSQFIENDELNVNRIISIVNKLPKLTALKVHSHGGEFLTEWQNKWEQIMSHNLKLFVAVLAVLDDYEDDPIDITVQSSERFTVFLKNDFDIYPTVITVVDNDYSQPLDTLQNWQKMELKGN